MLTELLDEMIRKASANELYSKIPVAEFEAWQQEFLFDALRGQLRYGQSFCNRFKIYDNMLYYSTSVEWSRQYIQNTYLEK